jgi:hypothetical protein
MQCEEFEDRLNAVLDERRRPAWDDELRLHCETCTACRQTAAAYDAMLDGFYALAAPDAPDDMALRVVAEMRADRPQARRWAAAVGALATAAVVLVVVGPLVRRGPQAPTPAAKPLANLASVAPAKQLPVEQIPLVPGLLSIAAAPEGDPYAGLAKETGQGLATVILYVPGVGGSRGIIDAEGAGGAGEPAWAVQMSEGLKPITNSVTETFDLLLRSLPVAQLASN